MENQLFRQKSMERISSPEELHDYMRVTSPRLWMILIAIVVLLAGFLIYASTANMENVVPIKLTLQRLDEYEGEGDDQKTVRSVTIVSGTIPASYLDTVRKDMKVRLGKETGKVSWIFADPETEELELIMEMEHDFIPLKDGDYDGELVLESTTPISFLWN